MTTKYIIWSIFCKSRAFFSCEFLFLHWGISADNILASTIWTPTQSIRMDYHNQPRTWKRHSMIPTECEERFRSKENSNRLCHMRSAICTSLFFCNITLIAINNLLIFKMYIWKRLIVLFKKKCIKYYLWIISRFDNNIRYFS